MLRSAAWFSNILSQATVIFLIYSIVIAKLVQLYLSLSKIQ